VKNSAELRAELDALEAEVREIADAPESTEEADARLDELTDLVPAARAEVVKAEKRESTIEAARVQADKPELRADFQIQTHKVETDVDARSANIGEVRDAGRKIIEDARWLSANEQETAERALFGRSSSYSSDHVARRLVATERPEYRSAFAKAMTGREVELSESERRAVSEVRAMSIGVDTAGGFGVPVLIDPTVLITDGTGLTGILDYARIESITTDAWRGVSAAHTSWSFDAEGATVSADDSTFAQPSVPVAMARGFIPHSIEVGEDYPGFAMEMSRLLSSGYMDLLASALATGSGSDAPTGIFTALDANASSEVVVTTDALFGAVDIDKVWADLPEKFRANSAWFMNVDVENEIRAFGSGTATSRFTVDQTAEGISRLNGKPVVLSDYAPTFTGTTGAANILVVGDFSNFLVAQRVGMNVEYIPHLFDVTYNRPTGTRGLFAYARVGSDSVVDNAFRLLQNQ